MLRPKGLIWVGSNHFVPELEFADRLPLPFLMRKEDKYAGRCECEISWSLGNTGESKVKPLYPRQASNVAGWKHGPQSPADSPWRIERFPGILEDCQRYRPETLIKSIPQEKQLLDQLR